MKMMIVAGMRRRAHLTIKMTILPKVISKSTTLTSDG